MPALERNKALHPVARIVAVSPGRGGGSLYLGHAKAGDLAFGAQTGKLVTLVNLARESLNKKS